MGKMHAFTILWVESLSFFMRFSIYGAFTSTSGSSDLVFGWQWPNSVCQCALWVELVGWPWLTVTALSSATHSETSQSAILDPSHTEMKER